MPNRINHNLPINSANQNVQQTHLLTKANEKHDSIKTASELTNTKLDTLSGAINNNLGDAQVKLQTYVYAHDGGNGQARPLQCDANGHLKVSNDVLEVSAETVNLNTDTLETKIQATNDKLDSFSGAGNNNIGEGQTKLQTYLYARDVAAGNFKPLVCDSDAHLQVDCLTSALPTGAATESTLSNVKTSVELLDDVVTAQSAAHPSKAFAIGGRYYVDNTFRDLRVDNIGKLIVDSPSGSDICTRLDNITNNTSSINDAEVHLSAIDTNIVTLNTNIAAMKIFNQDAELHLSALDTNISSRLPTTIGPKDEALSLTIARNNTVGAFDTFARTTISDKATSTALLCSSEGRLACITKTAVVNHSEVVYFSSQSISGSSSVTGSSISVDANTKFFFFEHNVSSTDVSFLVQQSLDGTNFFDTQLAINAGGGMGPGGTLTGINSIGGSSETFGFTPFIRLKAVNGSGSAQTATLSYVQQIG